MAKFTLNDIEDKSEQFKQVIKPGITEIEIIDFQKVVPDDATKSTDYQLKMTNKLGNLEYTFHNYATDGAMKWNLVKAKHLATNSDMSDAEASKIGGETQEELLESILKALVGKKSRVLFSGEEYMRDGEIKVKTSIGLPPFAEKISIPESDSGLKFDPNSKWHFKRLPEELKQNIQKANEGGQGDLEGLQF